MDPNVSAELNLYALNSFKWALWCNIIQQMITTNPLETDPALLFGTEAFHMSNTEDLMENKMGEIVEAISYVNDVFLGNNPITCGAKARLQTTASLPAMLE